MYFLEVEDYFGTPDGDYAVAVQLAASGDHAETHQAATLLRLVTAQELEGIKPETLLSTAGRLAADDTDMFRIDVHHDGTPVFGGWFAGVTLARTLPYRYLGSDA